MQKLLRERMRLSAFESMHAWPTPCGRCATVSSPDAESPMARAGRVTCWAMVWAQRRFTSPRNLKSLRIHAGQQPLPQAESRHGQREQSHVPARPALGPGLGTNCGKRVREKKKKTTWAGRCVRIDGPFRRMCLSIVARSCILPGTSASRTITSTACAARSCRTSHQAACSG